MRHNISFDAIRGANGAPIPYHQITNPEAGPTLPSKKAGTQRVSFSYYRTKEGTPTSVLGSVMAAMDQLYNAVKPEMLAWVPGDPRLQKMYMVLVKKFGQGKYTLVGGHDTLVRNDMIPHLKPGIKPTGDDEEDIWSDPSTYQLF